MNWKNRLLKIIPLLIIYVLVLGIRIYWISQKNGFHIDEAYSITIACNNVRPIYTFEGAYSGKQIKEMVFCDNNDIKNYFSDIYHLWENNNWDKIHTNFYYSLLRTSLIGLVSGDIDALIFRGCLLNLILFTISFFMLFKLMQFLFKNNKTISYIAVFCTFVTTATISNTILLRPYQLQETCFIVFTFYFLKFFNKPKTAIIDYKLFVDFTTFFLLILVTGLALFTHYLSLMFVGLWYLYAILHNFFRKNHHEIFIYCMAFSFAILLVQVCYPRYLLCFISTLTMLTKGNDFASDGNQIKNMIDSFTFMLNALKDYYFFIPIIITLILMLIYLFLKRIKLAFPPFTLSVFLIAIVYIFVAANVAVFKLPRYLIAGFPFLIILPMCILQSIKNRKILYITIGLLCVFFVYNSFNIDRMQHVYKDKPKEYAYINNPDIPVFLSLNKHSFPLLMFQYFENEQTYTFVNNITDILDNQKPKEFYMVISKQLENETFSSIYQSDYTIESTFDVGYNADTDCSYFEGIKIKQNDQIHQTNINVK